LRKVELEKGSVDKMVRQEDTICAIVTPPGIGGISVIRLSGKGAIAIASKLFRSKSGKLLTKAKTHTIHYGYIVDPASGEKIDEVLVSIMRSPHSFTCEDVVEVSCHGNPLITSRLLETFFRAGARPAEAGEFTKRAFLNGRIDLAQAEAVMEIIRARTEEGLRCGLWQLDGKLSNEINRLKEDLSSALAYLEAYIDFPEEELETTLTDVTKRIESATEIIERLLEGYYRWRPLREGVLTSIVGRTNVGKSSLLNTLIGEERAIVTPYPGTTRDIVDVEISIHGILLRLLDTAGLRATKDVAEEEGIKRMYRAIEMAELVLLVLDGSVPLTEEDREILGHTVNKKRIIVINKMDLGKVIGKDLNPQGSPVVWTSAIKREGIEKLKDMIRQSILGHGNSHPSIGGGEAVITNVRHKAILEKAKEDLHLFLESTGQGAPLEIMVLYLRDAIDLLGEITGTVTTEDILDRIFNEFCIGK